MDSDSLSNNAARLLGVLRQHDATAPPRAMTDARLAELTHLPEREIIDAAGELLESGQLVIARTTAPYGRYLLSPGDDLAEAEHYLHTLTSRAIAIFRRRRAVKRCLALYRDQAAYGGQVSDRSSTDASPRPPRSLFDFRDLPGAAGETPVHSQLNREREGAGQAKDLAHAPRTARPAGPECFTR